MTHAYDIIGDIHGHEQPLRALLNKLGYHEQDGAYRHPQRQVIFLGDLIDRGPEQLAVLSIVRTMVEVGTAQCVMGNHEYNALAYATPDPAAPSDYLRPHNSKNDKQHVAFITAVGFGSALHHEWLGWFRTLPLWLDLGAVRIVHACWDNPLMARLQPQLGPRNTLTDALLLAGARKGSDTYEAIETLLKGKEIRLPNGQTFRDKDTHERHDIRVRWHDNARNYREAYLGPESSRIYIPETPIDVDYTLEYSHREPPVFIGHYWFDDPIPAPLAANIACLDYGIAKDGKLVAYRWDGETVLTNDKFVWVT